MNKQIILLTIAFYAFIIGVGTCIYLYEYRCKGEGRLTYEERNFLEVFKEADEGEGKVCITNGGSIKFKR